MWSTKAYLLSVITHVVDTITTVESVTCDKAILYPEPIIQDEVTEVSVSLVPPPAPDSGVRSHHQPAASGVRLHSGPPDNVYLYPPSLLTCKYYPKVTLKVTQVSIAYVAIKQ